MNASQAKGIMVALDACFSGGGRSITPKGSKPMFLETPASLIQPKGKERVVITSSAGNQQSWEDEKELKSGIFSHYLLEGLKGRGGKETWVNAGELTGYIKANVPKAAKRLKNADQNPQVFGQAGFAVSRNWERHKVLDPEMARARLKSAFENKAITAEQFNRATKELKAQGRSRLLESFLEGEIDEKTFGESY